MHHKVIKITVPEVHDGLGGVHKAGDVVALPADVAAIFIERNCGVPATDADRDQAITQAEQDADQRRLDLLKASAVARMQVFDMMPPNVRDAAREQGDDAITEHMNEIVKAEEKKRGRGRPRKVQPAQEHEDDPFDEQ
jgi:hypothetical protein